MGRLPEITTVAQISAKMSELKDSYDLVTILLNNVTAMKTKLKLDLSPDCKEFGKYAGFMADCRDKLIDQKILDLVLLLNNITIMNKAIDPANGMLNSEFNKTLNEQNETDNN